MGHEEHEGNGRRNEMRGSSSSAFSVSLPADHQLTIPLYFLGLDPSKPPGLPVSFCARQSAVPGVTLDYNDIKYCNIISKDSEMNNKMVTSFKTIKR